MRAEVRLQMARPRDLPLPTVSPEQDLNSLDGMGGGEEPVELEARKHGGEAHDSRVAGAGRVRLQEDSRKCREECRRSMPVHL